MGALLCTRAMEAIIKSPHHVVEIPWDTRKENIKRIYNKKGFCQLEGTKWQSPDGSLQPTNSNRNLHAILACLNIVIELTIDSITRTINKLKPSGQREGRKKILT